MSSNLLRDHLLSLPLAQSKSRQSLNLSCLSSHGVVGAKGMFGSEQRRKSVQQSRNINKSCQRSRGMLMTEASTRADESFMSHKSKISIQDSSKAMEAPTAKAFLMKPVRSKK